jgi:hypothetical protein
MSRSEHGLALAGAAPGVPDFADQSGAFTAGDVHAKLSTW